MGRYRINLLYYIFIYHSIILSQSTFSNKNNFSFRSILKNTIDENFFRNNNSKFSYNYNTSLIFNKGHPNLDNNAELFVPGTSTKLVSARLEYGGKWIYFALEPYKIDYNGITVNPFHGTYSATNNHFHNNNFNKSNIGFRQSSLILHYNGIGIGIGNMSHWWGPGFHSALALTNNAPSQKTYAIGTFKDIEIGKFSFGSKIITMPYNSNDGIQLYFSGLKAHFSYHTKSTIITLGLHRTYLSGDFKNLNSTTIGQKSWSFIDATRLVFEPLFGQNKKNLDYTKPGTPGFDIWDEMLTGFVKFSFPKIGVQVYADLASDDNRGNLTDLIAHWDHTLGYQLGITKKTKLNNNYFFTGIEFLSTRISNTFNPKFYRGEEIPNYYTKPIYDYFTYKGRRMGAHSGSSSDDLIFLFAFGNNLSETLVSINKERHGIKDKIHHEVKNEFIFTYQRNIYNNHSIHISFEYERIKNYGFIPNAISESKMIWFGYSFSII